MMRKGLVIANCQARGFATTLSLFCKDIAFFPVHAHLMGEAKINEIVAENAGSVDVVCSFRLSEKFGPLSEDLLQQSFPAAKILFISNFYFSGLHPDQTYIGAMNKRCQGILGDYHSKIALLAFMAGRRAADADTLFGSATFQQLGFYDEYDTSMARWVELDSKSDVGFSAELFELMRSQHMLFAVNHPTSLYFFLYAQKIARTLATRGLARVRDLPWNPLLYPNFLADGPIFPIYPDIARRHGCKFAGDYLYKAPARAPKQSRFIDRAAFLVNEWMAFKAFGRAKIAHTTQWAQLRDQAAERNFVL